MKVAPIDYGGKAVYQCVDCGFATTKMGGDKMKTMIKVLAVICTFAAVVIAAMLSSIHGR